jgi:SAM-dependent methyltransferase
MIKFMQRLMRWLQFNWMYFGRPPWDTGTSPPELLAFIQAQPPGRALDLGCGTGTNMLTLAQAGWQVTGMDFAVRAVKQARRRLKSVEPQAQVVLGDVSRMTGIDGPFDLVLDIGCYHGLPGEMRAGYRENLLRVLGPHGRFLLYCHLSEDEKAPFGLHPQDFELLNARLSCLSRQDSQDRWGRQAAWLLYGRRDEERGPG